MNASGRGNTSAPLPARMLLDAGEHRRRARRYSWRGYLTAYAFLAPSFFFLVTVLVIPALWVVYLSFNRGGIVEPPKFVGLANWVALASDPVAAQAVRNTIVYALIITPVSFICALGLAMLLKQMSRGRNTLRAMIYFPTLTPYVMGALIWIFVVHPDFGILNVGFRLAGLKPPNWLGSQWSLISVVMLVFWQLLGYWTIIFLAALMGLPDELYQAAEMDGARAWAKLRYVTLPQLRPVFLFALVIATIWNIQVFDPVLVLTDGGPAHTSETVAVYLYKQTFQFFNPGIGAAMSVLVLLFILLLTAVQLRLLRRR